MKNITSFKDFKKIKEAKEFVNDTTWNESYVGRFVNSIFKGIGKILKMTYQQGLMTYLESRIRNEFFKGIILWAHENNFDLESGNFISADGRIQNDDEENVEITNDQEEDGEKEEDDVNIKNRKDSDLEETYNTVIKELENVNSLDDIKNNEILNPQDFQKLIGKYRQQVQNYERQKNKLIDKKNTLEKEIKGYKNPPSKKQAELNGVNDKINDLNKKIQNNKEFININKKTFEAIKNKVEKLGGSVTKFGEILGGKKNNKDKESTINSNKITSKNINDELNNLSEIKGKIKKERLINITNNFIQAINNMADIEDERKTKLKNWLKNIVGSNVYSEATNENMLLNNGFELLNEKKAVSIFSKKERKRYGLNDDDIKDVDMKKINYEKLAKVIDQKEATKKVNINRIFSYHLSAENLYIKGSDDRNSENKKLKNEWVQKINRIKADFRDFLQVEKLDPTSESFLLNKSKIKEIEKDYESDDNKIEIKYKLADEAKERIDSFDLKKNMLSVDDMRKKNEYYLITARWGYKSSNPNKKVVFSAKYINVLGYDVLAITDTYSDYFLNEFNINDNKNIANKKDKEFMDYLYGEEYEFLENYDVTRYRMNDVKKKMSFMFCKNLTLPQTHSSEFNVENSFYIFNILNDNLYVPQLANGKEEKTLSKPIEKVVKNKESDNKMNNLKIEVYPSYTINVPNTLIDRHMKVKNINSFKDEIQNYFKIKFR